MDRETRWEPRRLVSRAVRVAVFVVPLVVGVAAATLVAHALPDYDSLLGGFLWWAFVLVVSFVAVNITERVASKFLPLASLLNMSLLFPGEAPSRVKVALRTWSTGQLKARIREAREQGLDDDPTRAGETVLVLVAALNAHDRITRGHAERTRAYVDVLAEELGVAEADREKLRWVALLHDVGKLKISEKILNKEGKLDDDEWIEIRRHPQLGDDLIAPIRPFLGPWANTILHHHERFDGTGYPLGLEGDEIALGARIVAVADAFDAMTARRSYQPAMSARFALRELSENAGTQFDPMVVRAFLSLSGRRLRRLVGPLTALAELPFVAGFQRAAEWAGSVATGGVAVVAAVATGLVGPVSGTIPLVEALPTTTTTVVEAPATTTTSPPTTTTVPTTTAPPRTTTTSSTTTTTTTSTTTSTTTTAPPPPTTATTTTTTTLPPTTTTTTTSLPPTTTTTTTTTTTAAPNSAPIAVNDSATTSPPSPVDIPVLGNDSDPDGDSLTIVEFDALSSQGGTVSCTTVCRYEPPADWSPPDTFSYTISDGKGGAAIALVTVGLAG